MISYTINKSLEGHKNDATFVRIFPAGWVGMHYVIEELINESHFDMKLIDGEELAVYLKKLKGSGVMGNVDMAHYLACDVAENKVHKESNKPPNP